MVMEMEVAYMRHECKAMKTRTHGMRNPHLPGFPDYLSYKVECLETLPYRQPPPPPK